MAGTVDALFGMMKDHLDQQQQHMLVMTQAQSAAASQPLWALRVVMVEKEVQAGMESVSVNGLRRKSEKVPTIWTSSTMDTWVMCCRRCACLSCLCSRKAPPQAGATHHAHTARRQASTQRPQVQVKAGRPS